MLAGVMKLIALKRPKTEFPGFAAREPDLT